MPSGVVLIAQLLLSSVPVALDNDRFRAQNVSPYCVSRHLRNLETFTDRKRPKLL